MRSSDDRTSAWPALVDLLAGTLLIFVLMSVLSELASVRDAEVRLVRQKQQRFVDLASQQFSRELAEKQFSIARDQDSLVVTFSNRVLFDSGEYELSPQGRAFMERWRDFLADPRQAEYSRIQIEGHTDSVKMEVTAYPRNNWQLSAARAISVVEVLAVGNPEREAKFSANAYSYHRPVASNETAVGRSLNRRVEMRVYFTGLDGGSPSRQGEAV